MSKVSEKGYNDNEDVEDMDVKQEEETPASKMGISPSNEDDEIGNP